MGANSGSTIGRTLSPWKRLSRIRFPQLLGGKLLIIRILFLSRTRDF
ncbi:hypothetical protein ACFX15_018233 [Malus domestica]